MHLGSLYTALASYLDARSQHGYWLLRIDDIDTPRNIRGASERIIRDLEKFGLHWDERVYYQSENLARYFDIITQLSEQQLLYRCTCSRKSLAALNPHNPVYPGICRHTCPDPAKPAALRLKTEDIEINFADRLQGLIRQNLSRELGDFVVQRKDNIVAYQLAVVIDDYQQGITDIVRGFDLLDSTPRQIFIQQLLGYSRPRYMHVPLIVDEQGVKLSKQTHAEAVDTEKPEKTLYRLLRLLRQDPPKILLKAQVEEILEWAVARWNPQHLKKIRAIH